MIALSLAIAAAVVVIDQIIKYFVSIYLPNAGTVEFIPYILDLDYVENRGVAFGMFKDMRWIFIAITSVVICFLLYIIIFRRINSKLFNISASLIIGGGIGNLIDRIYYGYVIDYLQLSFFSPVCNFADYAITIGTALLVIYVLFFYDKNKKVDDNVSAGISD
ncbi:MAG: signal peptidase II [Oscillospiraceae bacterium]|nr:signal peptidase II [Oscillospiraceae bacterium]